MPGADEQVRAADEAAMEDALTRAAEHFRCPADRAAPGWASDLPVVIAWTPVGPSAEALPAGLLRVRRGWDEAAWPHAARGYFQTRAAIPKVLEAVGDSRA